MKAYITDLDNVYHARDIARSDSFLPRDFLPHGTA